MVGKPLKAESLSTCTVGVGLLLSRPSPGVEMPVADLLRAHLGGGCPSARFLGTGMLMECPKETPFFEGVPCTALMLSSKPLRSCSMHSTDESMALDTALVASSVLQSACPNFHNKGRKNSLKRRRQPTLACAASYQRGTPGGALRYWRQHHIFVLSRM